MTPLDKRIVQTCREAAERIQSLEAALSIAKRGLSGLAVYPGSGAGARKIASEILARMTNA